MWQFFAMIEDDGSKPGDLTASEIDDLWEGVKARS